ncbi:MAG TPA: CinA family nicotinamide mononucleotide deamidase-related protein, partial [Chitinophagales bacterium]|nr:CinA family nicotinamide mononucleotide deamidase-related protein [Chitinophagales bacterium]
MKATILSIGDELLIGQTLNTNAHWMSQQLTAIGVDVLRHVSVSDKRAEIVGALDTAMADTQVILITGGLGPTSDDITKDVLCEYFGGALVFNEAAYENIRQIFNRRNREISEATRQVAFLPDNCLPIQNAFGTAAGMLFRRDDRVVVSMPGVPYEMKAMVENGVIPYLQSEFTLPLILHHHFYTAGVGETQLAELLTDFEKNKPADMGLAYLPSVGKVRLRLTLKGQDKADLQSRMQAARETVYAAVKAHVYAEEDIPLEQVVGRLLAERGKTLGTAESCTGGYIAHLITSVAGSSDYFKGSVISYSNEIKQ